MRGVDYLYLWLTKTIKISPAHVMKLKGKTITSSKLGHCSHETPVFLRYLPKSAANALAYVLSKTVDRGNAVSQNDGFREAVWDKKKDCRFRVNAVFLISSSTSYHLLLNFLAANLLVCA